MKWEIFRGLNGGFEWTRSLGGFGVIVFILVAAGLECWVVLWLGKPFDLQGWCTYFPLGLGGSITAIGLTAGSKEKSVATAQVIRDTNSLPAQPGAKP